MPMPSSPSRRVPAVALLPLAALLAMSAAARAVPPEAASSATATPPVSLPAAPQSPAMLPSPSLPPLPDERAGVPPLPDAVPRAPLGATLAPRDFTALDVDGDGLLDGVEAAADPILAERFAVLDLDDDDHLSREEFASYQPGPAGVVGE